MAHNDTVDHISVKYNKSNDVTMVWMSKEGHADKSISPKLHLDV